MAALRVVCAILAMSVLAESWYLNRYNAGVGQWQSCETHVADGCCSAPRVSNFGPVTLCFDMSSYLFTVNAGSYGQYNLDLTCDGTGNNGCDDWFGECGSANVAPCSSSKFWNELVEVHSYPNAKVKAPTAVVQAEVANETVKVAAKDPAAFGYTLYRTGGSDTQSCATYGSGYQCCGAGKVGKLNPVTLCFNDANDQFSLNAGSYGQYSFILSSSGSCSFYGSYSDHKFWSESISVSCHSEKEEAKVASVAPETVVV